MGLLDRLRRKVQDQAGIPPAQREVGPSLEDVELLYGALLVEAKRLGRERIALSVFLEHTELQIAGLDLYPMLHHLAADGRIRDYRQDSFGNAHFDLPL